MPVLELPTSQATNGRQRALARALASAVDAKGQYVEHGASTARLARMIGERLGLQAEHLDLLELAGLTHDVGKLRTPDAVLLSTGGLAAHEWSVIQQHPVDGHRMLLEAGMGTVARWVLHHHERWDGGGYPTGLLDSAIPLEARILAVADAFDVIVAPRTYKPAGCPEAALTELCRCAGSQFDPEVVVALVEACADRGLRPATGDCVPLRRAS